MKKVILYIFFSLSIISCGGCSQKWHTYKVSQEEALLETYGYKEQYVFSYKKPVNKKWVIEARELTSSKTDIYIPLDENMSNWSQAIYQTYVPSLANPPQYFLDQTKLLIKDICLMSDYKIIFKSSTELAFRLSGFHCKDSNRVTATKIIQASDGIYILQYFAVPDRVAQKFINQGTEAVLKSSLIRNH